MGAIDEEEGLEDLLDELAGSDEEDDLVAGPAGDAFCMEVEDVDEAELECEPGEFDDDPEQEIDLERHFPDEGVADEHGIDAQHLLEPSFLFWVGVHVRISHRRRRIF